MSLLGSPIQLGDWCQMFCNLNVFTEVTSIRQSNFTERPYHFVLINIARFFEHSAQDQLPSKDKSSLDAYYKSAFTILSHFKCNFKNCLIIVGNYLHELIHLSSHRFCAIFLPRIINAISRVRQRIRPNRSFPRVSYKPRGKWSISHTIGTKYA